MIAERWVAGLHDPKPIAFTRVCAGPPVSPLALPGPGGRAIVTSTMVDPIAIPDRLNMAQWFLDARIDEGLGDKTAIYYEDEQVTYQMDLRQRFDDFDLQGEVNKMLGLAEPSK